MAKNNSDTNTEANTESTQEVEAVNVTITETPTEQPAGLRPETISEMEAGKAALTRYQKA
jgi:hypothetical protein